MTRRELDGILRAWKVAELSPTEALRRSAPEWRKIAAYLWRRYGRRMPVWASFEDLHQVVLMNVPRLVAAYRDIGPGSSIAGYVCQNAMRLAEKAVHRWRNARRGGCNPRLEPSRFELPAALMPETEDGEAGFDRALDRALATPPEQEDRLQLAEVLEAEIARAADVAEAVALRALLAAGGSVPLAADALWRSPSARLFCSVRSARAARRLVERAAGEVEARLSAA